MYAFLKQIEQAPSDWQSTEAFLYVIGKSNSMLTWTYIIVLDIKENPISNFSLYKYTL